MRNDRYYSALSHRIAAGIRDAAKSAHHARGNSPAPATEFQPDGAGAAVSEEDAAAAAIARATDAEGAADLFRGGEAGRGVAAAVARNFAAGRKWQVRRPSGPSWVGTECE